MLKIILPAFFIILLPLFNKAFSWASSIISMFTIFICSLFFLIPPFLFPFMSNNKLFLDFLNIPLILLTMWISSLMILASFSSFIKNQSPNMFLFLILTLNILLMLTFSSSNIILFFIFFESTLIPTLLIILGWGYQPERLQAGFYLMIYTITASLPLLINLLFIFMNNKSISLINPFWVPPCPNIMFSLWWLSLILAFMVKMPMYTLHLWLPKAHVEAPVAGSMILAGLLLKLGSYGILRLATMFPFINKSMMPIILSISMWGAIITSTICIRQPDMKSLIAYSSIGHMGLLTSGTMTMMAWGWESSLLMMIAHGLSSPALFALANIMYETTQTRNLFLTKGMLALFPASTFLWFLASSANMAAPTSLNLLSEILLLSTILSSSKTMILIIAMSIFMAAVYSLFLYTTTQHGKPSNFVNPLQMFSMRNLLVIILHLLPLFFLCLKMDLVVNWL